MIEIYWRGNDGRGNIYSMEAYSTRDAYGRIISKTSNGSVGTGNVLTSIRKNFDLQDNHTAELYRRVK